jgi:hypothetical protein
MHFYYDKRTPSHPDFTSNLKSFIDKLGSGAFICFCACVSRFCLQVGGRNHYEISRTNSRTDFVGNEIPDYAVFAKVWSFLLGLP